MKIAAMGSLQGMGGLQTHFQLLQRFLAAEGHELLSVAVADQGQIPVTAGPDHAIRHTTTSVQAKFGKWIEFRRARKAIRQFAPELFIAAAAGRMYAAMASSLSSGVISFYQEVICDLDSNDPVRAEMNRRFKAVAVQSPSMEIAYRRAMGSSMPIRVVPCFASPPAAGFRARSWKPGEPVRLGYFGRLAPNKGLVEFIEALEPLAQELDLQFDIHGSGPEKDNIAARIGSTGLSGRVRLCGRYPDGEEGARLMISYHGLVLPSTHCEGLPLILLEAMSYGLPFLSTTIGAIPDAAAGNPDVLICSPDTNRMRQGLGEFVRRIKTSDFNTARLKEYFEKNFSAVRMENQWREMLVDPRTFFGLK